MRQYESVTMLYGFALLVVCALILGACGQGHVVIDRSQGFYFEVVMLSGEHILVPSNEVVSAERMSANEWFVWKTDNTGFYGVDLVAYGKKTN